MASASENGITASRAGVLVVEDDPGLRSSTAEILRGQGFDVAEAADGAAATWTLANREIDVVVLDLRLRLVDGVAVLDALEPEATVVITSAFGACDEAAIREEFSPMIFDCLHKPVPPALLVEVVTAAASAGRREARAVRVKPIDARDALRLALVAMARLRPQAH